MAGRDTSLEGAFEVMGNPEGRWEVQVTTSAGFGYPVRVGRGILDELGPLLQELSPAQAYVLIADGRVFDLYGDRISELCSGLSQPLTVHTFPPGEASKNRREWAELSDALLSEGLGRDGCVIALGGGVAGDLAGFVAATYMRGISLVQIPTSLVAMVDASVGGKTGIDSPLGKNLVGAFHPPRFVLADTELSATLPRRERSQGLAEAVKHGAILDAEYFEWIDAHIESLLNGDPDDTATLVARSVQLKARVVSEDEREGGLRQILNFGHTLGHAVEAESNFLIPHGSAVAVGMVLEARLGERLGVTVPGVADRLAGTLTKLELPTSLPNSPDPEDLMRFVSRDKKARRGVSRYVLLSGLGEVDPGDSWSRDLDPSKVREFLIEESSKSV
jgi:3-dehydroquinate synthase